VGEATGELALEATHRVLKGATQYTYSLRELDYITPVIRRTNADPIERAG
jgi:hypothetical protein